MTRVGRMQSFYYFIEVAVTRQESGLACISVLGVSILPLFTILIFDFGMVPPVWYFLFYILFLVISLSQMSSECVT